MLLDVLLFLLAVSLGVIAMWRSRPQPLAFDPERLFKVCHSALAWGAAEAEAGGDAGRAEELWAERLMDEVLYNPAARAGQARLDAPDPCSIPVPALPGERALVEDLEKLPRGEERFRRMFHHHTAQDAVMSDPQLLGPDYDPSRWLAPGMDWAHLIRWGDPALDAVRRRLEAARLVVLNGPEEAELAAGMGATFREGAAVEQIGVQDCAPAGDQAGELAAWLRGLAPARDDRLVLLALGDAGLAALGALWSDGLLRDRVSAVVLFGAPLGGVPGPAPKGLDEESVRSWGEEHLTQEAMDTEVRRSTPYLCLQRLRPDATPAGDGRVPWSSQVMEEPPVPPSGRRPVEVVDLGPVPASTEVGPALCRALLCVLAARLR